EYRKALAVYLALWVDRIAVFNNAVSRWKLKDEAIAPPFSGQSIPMMWDYPEVNFLADTSGSGSTQLEYMLKVVAHECPPADAGVKPSRILCGDGAKLPLDTASADFVVTDPPYFIAISYADLYDFF